MFHRVKSEPAQGPFNQAPQNQSADPVQTQQVTPPPAKPQTASASLAPATTQDNTKKEEATTMTTDQAKKTDTAVPDSSAPRALDIPGGAAYQRPGQPPLRTGGTFPGAYPGYNPHAAPGAAISTDRRLIIGRGITMSGEIESCDHLIVEGTVEATLKGASVLDIAESGVFYGTVDIDEATVAGRFEGDLQVKGRLTIRAGGAITGSIVYKELEVEAGATIDGKLSPVGAQHDAKKNTKNVGKMKRDSSESVSGEDGLFASKTAAE
ncbi:MAG: polymer-forming cytoskeletal protein [Alphaproteobacteria bacterium]